jgi:hypothetical protein
VSLSLRAPRANTMLAIGCFLVSAIFIYRSFYNMRINSA